MSAFGFWWASKTSTASKQNPKSSLNAYATYDKKRAEKGGGGSAYNLIKACSMLLPGCLSMVWAFWPHNAQNIQVILKACIEWKLMLSLSRTHTHTHAQSGWMTMNWTEKPNHWQSLTSLNRFVCVCMWTVKKERLPLYRYFCGKTILNFPGFENFARDRFIIGYNYTYIESLLLPFYGLNCILNAYKWRICTEYFADGEKNTCDFFFYAILMSQMFRHINFKMINKVQKVNSKYGKYTEPFSCWF